MTTLHKPTLFAASVLLAFATSASVAQTAPTKPSIQGGAAKPAAKTLSGKPAGGKLMSRDELRSCMKRVDEMNQGGKDLEALKPQLDRDRDELKASGEALKTERAELDRQLAAVREWEVRMRAHVAAIDAYNKRNAAAAEAPSTQQQRLSEEMKPERERLQKEREALDAEQARLVPAYQAGVKAHNERVTARDAKVTDWNGRNAAAVEASVKQQEARALWLNECANRPYREDDEVAIKAGK